MSTGELAQRNTTTPATTEAGVLAMVDQGRLALEAAVQTGDPANVADIIRRAEAIRYLSKKAKLALAATNAASHLKIDAERRAGAMLRDMDRAKGRPEKVSPRVTLSVAYAVKPLRTCYLLQFQSLRTAVDNNLRGWIDLASRKIGGYQWAIAKNSHYKTVSIIVPLDDLTAAMTAAMTVTWTS